MVKIFLSGSVHKEFSDLNVGKRYWEKREMDELKKQLRFDVKFLDPNEISRERTDMESEFSRDMEMLLESDMVLVRAFDKQGLGVGAEMALAKYWKIPVFTIVPVGSHYYRTYEDGTEWIHSFVYELSDRLFHNISDFANYANELYDAKRVPLSTRLNAVEAIDRLNAYDSGYDDGYKCVNNFWGVHPAKLVIEASRLLSKQKHESGLVCLDLGCGHGKNSIFLSNQGFEVYAMDSSFYAIHEARLSHPEVHWCVRDIRKLCPNGRLFDMIVMTGSLHCLPSAEDVRCVVRAAQSRTRLGGFHVLSAFNSSDQDLSGHAKTFHPLLLDHSFYLSLYNGWKLLAASNEVQDDIHPHNNIRHRHSITRILAVKEKE